MQTVGEILKKKRKKKKLTLEEVERVIKIKKKFLRLLEDNNFEKLPSETYVRGFIKNYADFLGLRSKNVLAIFRRQYKGKTILTPQNKEESFFKITPERARLALFTILLILFLGYLFRQYQSLTYGPPLALFEPSKNIFTEEKITVRGKTEPGSRVFINERQIFPNEKGEFSQEIFLSKGLNEIVVIAENKMGKKRTVVKEVTFEPF